MSPRPRSAKKSVWHKLLDPDDEKGKYDKSEVRTTPQPSKEQRLADDNWKLSQENAALQDRLAYYNDAVRSIVMRLKVLDIDKLKDEMGPDGTIPMRMMVRELEALAKAYDGKIPSYSSCTDSPSPTPSCTPSQPPRQGGGFY